MSSIVRRRYAMPEAPPSLHRPLPFEERVREGGLQGRHCWQIECLQGRHWRRQTPALVRVLPHLLKGERGKRSNQGAVWRTCLSPGVRRGTMADMSGTTAGCTAALTCRLHAHGSRRQRGASARKRWG